MAMTGVGDGFPERVARVNVDKKSNHFSLITRVCTDVSDVLS
jgi:hypothetical protein